MSGNDSNSEEKAQWQKSGGFAADSKMVHIIVPETKADTWDEEAEDTGFNNRSDYLRTLIGEARAHRQVDRPEPEQAEQRIQELQSEVERLRDELEQERQNDAGRVEIDDTEFVEEFLTDQYQPLSDILQHIVESGALNDLIRKRVEDQLYFMASQDRAAYQRGWGWKRADNGGGR